MGVDGCGMEGGSDGKGEEFSFSLLFFSLKLSFSTYFILYTLYIFLTLSLSFEDKLADVAFSVGKMDT